MDKKIKKVTESIGRLVFCIIDKNGMKPYGYAMVDDIKQWIDQASDKELEKLGINPNIQEEMKKLKIDFDFLLKQSGNIAKRILAMKFVIKAAEAFTDDDSKNNAVALFNAVDTYRANQNNDNTKPLQDGTRVYPTAGSLGGYFTVMSDKTKPVVDESCPSDIVDQQHDKAIKELIDAIEVAINEKELQGSIERLNIEKAFKLYCEKCCIKSSF